MTGAERTHEEHQDGAVALTQDLEFPDRLRRAIARRGLGLERLSARLEERGVSCSASTISLWRNGYTRPRRYEAMLAVHALEGLLGTEPGYLSRAPHPVVVGSTQWWEQSAVPEEVLHEGADFERAANSLGAGSPNELQRLAVTEITRFDAQGRFSGSRCQMVLQAAKAGAERLVIGTYTEAVAQAQGRLRVVEPTSGARLGRRRVGRDSGQVVSELVLDAPLRRGEMTIVDYETVPSDGPEPRAEVVGSHEWRTIHPLGRLVLGVDFHPDALPSDIRVAEDPLGAAIAGEGRSTRLHGVRALASRENLTQGGLRISWSWEEER